MIYLRHDEGIPSGPKQYLIRLPGDVATELEAAVPKGQRSAFITTAVRGLLLAKVDIEAERQRVEFEKRVEGFRSVATAILDGLDAAGTGFDEWLVTSDADGALLMAVLRVARERGGVVGGEK